VETAARAYRDSRRIDPTFVPPLAGLAKVAWARGDLAEAIRRMYEVVTLSPLPAYATLLGDLHTVGGDPDAAQTQYDLVTAEGELFRSNGVNTDLEIALFQSDHGDPAAALAAARAEWDRRHSIDVADALAWALHANGRDARAARFARRSLALGTPNATFLAHAGMIQMSLGHRAAARALLTEALDTNPYFSVLLAPEARRDLARLGGAS
jgi:Flp pilus assembly protein TadD